RVARRHDRPGGDLRAGAGLDDVPHPRRGRSVGEQHAVRTCGERVDREHQPGTRCGAEDQSRRRVDQLHQPVRRGLGVWRVSGIGREGGKEGMWEYLKPDRDSGLGTRGSGALVGRPKRKVAPVRSRVPSPEPRVPPIDRTYKLFIGGAQVRPDQGYSRKILSPSGDLIAEVAEGNRKDIRNAVEAAHAAAGWSSTSGHNRGQILYYLAENLAQRAAEFAER